MNLPKAVPRVSGCGSLTEQVLSGYFSGLPVSASFDGKQHLRSLPVVNSLGYVLRFLTKLCRSLLCDDLFSHQPFPRGGRASQQAHMKEEGRIKSGKLPPRASHTSLGSPMTLRGHHSTSECASWRSGGLYAWVLRELSGLAVPKLHSGRKSFITAFGVQSSEFN